MSPSTHEESRRSTSPGEAAGVTTDSGIPDPQLSTAGLWTARILGGLGVLFLTFDASLKVLKLAPAVEGTTQLGYPESVIFTIGVIEVVCLILYVIPRTSVLGAVLWTGYLGGAIATHVRLESPLFSHTLFPIYIAALLWVPLWLRDARVRALLPLTKRS